MTFMRFGFACALAVAVGAFAAAAAASTPAGAVSISNPDTKLVRIIAPRDDALVKQRRVRVAVRVTRPVRGVSASVDRRPFAMRPAGGRRFVGVATGLRPGRNVVQVAALARDGRRGSAFVAVVHALRRTGLVRVRAPRRSGSPVSVSARVPRNEVRFRAWLNGKPVATRFSAAVHGVRRATLSASDGLRFGRNRLRVQAIADSRLRDRAAYDERVRTILVPRRRPLVGAGVDRRVRAGARVRLDGRASRPHVAGTQLRYRWRIVRRPRRSRARLRRPTAARPRLVTDRPGRYRVALVTRVTHSRLRMPGSAAMAVAAAPGSDVVTVAAHPTYPLIRVRASVPMGPGCHGITVGADQVDVMPDKYPNPGCGGVPGVHVLVLDRDTLARVDEQSFPNLNALSDYANELKSKYSADHAPLVIVNVDPDFVAADENRLVFQDQGFNALITAIGGWGYPSDMEATLSSGALIVGVPGWQRGDGFQSARPDSVAPGSLTGFLVLDQTNLYSFQPDAGQVQYRTAYGGGGGAGQMQIAGNNFAMTPATDPGFSPGMPAWTPGEPYVHLVAVRADEPSVGLLERAFAVDTIKCQGSPCTFDTELERMANTLNSYAGNRSALLFVQTVGSVYRYAGTDPGPSNRWYDVGDALGKVGGSPWVWDNMATTPGVEVNKNSYVLVGGQAVADENRVDGTEAGGQIPDMWTGGAGTTVAQGILALNNVGWFTPAGGLPTDSQNPATPFGVSLPELAYAPPTRWPDMDTAGKLAAYAWINSQHAKLDFACDKTDLPDGSCDIRYLYYAGTENDDWSTTHDNLGKLQRPNDANFTDADLNAVVGELQSEVQWVDDINEWYRDLRAPLVNSQGYSIVAVQQFGQNVINATRPPSDATAAWFSFAMDILGDLSGFAGLGESEVAKAISAVSQIASTAGDIAGNPAAGSGSDPITGEIQTKINQLGLTMANNMQATLDSMERVREIILSDYGKLSQVGGLVQKGGAWHADGELYRSTTNHIQLGVTRQAYQAVLPAIGRVYQVWSSMAWDLNNRQIDRVAEFRCRRGNQDTDGKPFSYTTNSIPPTHSEPPTGGPLLGMWPIPSDQNRPSWTSFVYRLSDTKDYGGRSPSNTLTDPFATPPTKNGVFATDPKTQLPGPGFYTPWLLSRGFQPIQFDCHEWDKQNN